MRGKNFFIDEAKLASNAPIDRLTDFLKADQGQITAREAQLRRDVTALQQRYRAQRVRLLGEETVRQLTDYSRQHAPRPEPRLVAPGQVLRERQARLEQSRQFARRLGVDLEALSRLNQQARTDTQRLLANPPSALGDIDVKLVDEGLAFRPLELGSPFIPGITPPLLTPMGGKPNFAQSAPYAWWDRGGAGYELGDGKILRNESRLNGDAGLSGSCVWYKNTNASDYDPMYVPRETGFLVQVVLPTKGLVKVQFDVTCLLCQHCMETYNEWGWSDYGAFTKEHFSIGVLWKWEDETPATESDAVVAELHGSGNGDNSPGVQYLVPAGQTRTVTLTSKLAFPANVPLWIYAGTQQRIYADLNDVSMNIFANSLWQFTQIRVTSA